MVANFEMNDRQYLHEPAKATRVTLVGADGSSATPAEGPPSEAILGEPVAVTVPATAGGIQMIAAAPTRVSANLFNNGAQTVYWGPTAAVTAATGFPMPAGTGIRATTWKGAIFGITAATTADVRVIQELEV